MVKQHGIVGHTDRNHDIKEQRPSKEAEDDKICPRQGCLIDSCL